MGAGYPADSFLSAVGVAKAGGSAAVSHREQSRAAARGAEPAGPCVATAIAAALCLLGMARSHGEGRDPVGDPPQTPPLAAHARWLLPCAAAPGGRRVWLWGTQ